MSRAFRELLKKVGSGAHTSKDLTRSEAAQAMTMMLTQEATPAQIGAFLIAHRIKRPTGEELAGMLDAYEQLGPKVPPINSAQPVVLLSQPYDGRDRTMPLSVLTALILAAAGCPVLQHGGERMPTKEGIPLIDLWQGLGVDWSGCSLAQIHQILEATNLGFVYLPTHFPQAQALVPYRDQIGKRPPLATLELIWSPYAGPCHVVAGFVHPPTETMIQEALTLRGVTEFTTVKGLEGSCDLPQERTAIIGLHTASHGQLNLTRLRLHAQDYGLGGKNPAWVNLNDAIVAMEAVLDGRFNQLRQALLWNSGFYLWQRNSCENLTAGIQLAAELLDSGQVKQQLKYLKQVCDTHSRH
ncbi:anthranilate phosphoribosyltransferase family protein [Synechococcus sp. PCC 6312]|uniref:anthranilate phosphoribosyltransferase family protein n=1 Tax=Synechococcus sp. (strain ATCC 27167 / PCC 6312) TaxID=195253 RepID=UPI00029ECFB8|nr:anthranilate phosphoribosyltransferase family protein [Synechococcus sp. PCC 6312]AFY60287.1 anthranilate phosphoribosyltransferase [Synechococcus sp. PCC 6312]